MPRLDSIASRPYLPAIISAQKQGGPMTSVENWSREDIKRGMAEGSLLLIDVREPHEFAMGHIPGSVSMPLSSFDPASIPVDPSRRVVFSCAAGVRSLRAIDFAQDAGLDLSAHYPGGFKDWAGSGEPVETD